MSNNSACASCAHFHSGSYGGFAGICQHSEGPTRVYIFRARAERPFPGGCPIDPDPRQVRKRPGKRRGPKPGPVRMGGVDL